MNGFEYARTWRNLGVEAVGDQASGKRLRISKAPKFIMKAPGVAGIMGFARRAYALVGYWTGKHAALRKACLACV